MTAVFERFRGRRGLVMGLGLFGGGTEAAKFLARYCDRVLVTDLRNEEVLAASIRELEGLPIEYRLGEHRRQDFEHAEVVIHTPAVRPDNPLLQAARAHGAEVTMEMSLFIEACQATTVGITGSNGKTTTALLCYEMLCEVMERAQPELAGKWAEPVGATLASPARAGKVWLGGNCGEPLINRLDEISKRDVVVLELSSFQLQDWHRIRKSCNFGLITNITPNHLDWHKDMAEYVWAKSAIAMYPTEEQQRADPDLLPSWCYINADDAGCLTMGLHAEAFSTRLPCDAFQPEISHKGFGRVEASGANGELVVNIPFTLRLDEEELAREELPRHANGWKISERADLRLPGEFNWSNAVGAAWMAGLAGGFNALESCAKALRRFRGVEHRLEFCGEVNGARCFNDSIATTPESTIAGLSAFEGGLHLLLGGSDKGLSFEALAAAIAAHNGIKGVYLQGANAAAIEGALARTGMTAPRNHFATFDEACEAAFAALQPGDVFLMSPASASFYEYAPHKRFTNFEHRGRHFKLLVQAHTSKTT
ncbi:MAG: hypothetical protein H6841_08635 [Planctomycetes bacterium]|nr:hypothetical protein [Planctomycetota bacterium]MCB9934826.1 hypothetical protein [Planctomycetota bacterium]